MLSQKERTRHRSRSRSRSPRYSRIDRERDVDRRENKRRSRSPLDRSSKYDRYRQKSRSTEREDSRRPAQSLRDRSPRRLGGRDDSRQPVRSWRDRSPPTSGRDSSNMPVAIKQEKRSPSPGKSSKKSKKSKKSKSKRRRSSSSSSASSVSSTELMVRLEQERKKQLEDARERKERLKAMETPEEKRIRRLMKKQEKERRRKEKMGWDTEYLHYTNSDNPFGDSNLLQSFVWSKKLEREGLKDASQDEIERINRLKMEESKRELEKVKKRRVEREMQRAARDEEEALLQREKEAAQFKEWGNQEDQFHLEQARLRSKIRIKDGRAKPIDLLAQYINAEEEVNAIEMHEPYTYLNGLTVTDLEDLIEDIKVYKRLEKGKNLSYWNDITVIVEDELRKLRKLEVDNENRMAMDRREGINPAVAQDVASIFKGKSADQLQLLKVQIQGRLDGSAHGVDISYWESLLSQLKAHIARAQLRDRHQENLQKKLALLKAEQGVTLADDGDTEEPSTSGDPAEIKIDVDESTRDSVSAAEGAASTEDEEEDEEDHVIGEAIARYEVGSYSPRLISQDDIEPGIFVIGEEEDDTRLELARRQVLKVGEKVENVWTAEEKALQQEAKKGMEKDEAVFSVESTVDQVYLWSDKYRPRKPRYFNRVHTGFEWNKYNQTHYDMDNPPPKIVQGYKFNIFYPDLIDKNSTPEYHLTACADNPDFSILRFHAGPPYEDIAFKVVNREWEYSYKRGFRCQFHNNIFQLWFHFKRYRYRR